MQLLDPLGEEPRWPGKNGTDLRAVSGTLRKTEGGVTLPGPSAVMFPTTSGLSLPSRAFAAKDRATRAEGAGKQKSKFNENPGSLSKRQPGQEWGTLRIFKPADA